MGDLTVDNFCVHLNKTRAKTSRRQYFWHMTKKKSHGKMEQFFFHFQL